MADHPLKPAMDRRLGEPLPHQLPNPTRADLLPIKSFPRRAHTVLLPVSRGYSVARGTFPRVTHPSAARSEDLARLACVRPAASVRSEPGSNSHVEFAPHEQSPRHTAETRPRKSLPGPKKTHIQPDQTNAAQPSSIRPILT